MTDERSLYVSCIEKQLEEIQLLSSIYCGAGELCILDPAYICDFEQFLNDKNAYPVDVLRTHLEFIVKLEIEVNKAKEKFDVRIELPHLYPIMEHPILTIQSSLLSKEKTEHLKAEVVEYLKNVDKQSPYIFQLLTWLQEKIEEVLTCDLTAVQNESSEVKDDLVEFERLWIYSHHIRSKAKRQEIIRQSRDLNLSGFSRPGKPGIICVEGKRENTQEFWSIIKSLHWKKINVCKSEVRHVPSDKLEKLRRFDGFKEQLFCEDEENDDVIMDMGLFIRFLEAHNSGYMKKELFGIE